MENSFGTFCVIKITGSLNTQKVKIRNSMFFGASKLEVPTHFFTKKRIKETTETIDKLDCDEVKIVF